MENYTDAQLLCFLEQEPQRGMVLLMESFTGLVWKVASLHLSNPEDVRECTNDVFSEFYFHMDSYDSEQASLAVWLAAIARHTAISYYRKELRHQTDVRDAEVPVDCAMLELAEAKADLAQAMETLRPDEQQIIRMKYYDNMTIAEIADSLGLPYETVKKRHQRSLRKMRPLVMFVLIVVLLLAATTVTSYAILRKKNLVPDFFRWVEEWMPEGFGGDTGKADDGDDGSDQNDTVTGWTDTWNLWAEDWKPIVGAQETDQEDSPVSDMTGTESSEINDLYTAEYVGQFTDDMISAGNDGTDDSSGDAVVSIGNYRYIPGYGIVIITGGVTDAAPDNGTSGEAGTGGSSDTDYNFGSYTEPAADAYVLGTAAAAEDDDTAIVVRAASCINGELKITAAVYSKTDPWRRTDTADDIRIQNLTDAALLYQDETMAFSVKQGSLTEDAYTMTVTLTIPDFVPVQQEELPMSLTLYGLSVDLTMVVSEGEEIENHYLYQMEEYGGLMVIPRREDGQLIVSIYPLNAGEYETLPGLVRGPYGEQYADGVLTVTDSDGNDYTGTCMRYRPGGSETYYSWNFGEVQAGEYMLYIPYLMQVASDEENADVLLDLTAQPAEPTAIRILGGSAEVSYSEPYNLSHDSAEYLAYEKKEAFLSSIGASAAYLNPDNFDYYDFCLSWTSDEEDHPIAGMNPDFSCDYNREEITGTAIVGGDTTVTASDFDACTVLYRCAINRQYDDPATLHMTFPLYSSWMPAVWYRWDQSFDFTFMVE